MLSPGTELYEPKPNLFQKGSQPKTRVVVVATAERGPIGVRTECNSEDDVIKTFGGHSSSFTLHKNVHAIFKEAKKYAQYVDVIRTCHYSDITDSSTYTAVKATGNITATTATAQPASVIGSNAGPWSLNPGDTIIASVNRGANQTATFDASAASVECSSAETYNITDGQTLTVKIDGGSEQTVTFNTGEITIGAATAEEVAAVINTDLSGGYAVASSSGTKVTIYSDTKGTDSEVEVTGGTANGVLGFSTTASSGTGDVADISSVTATEAIALLEADIAGISVTQSSSILTISTTATGTSAHIQIQSSSSAELVFGFDTAEHEGTNAGTTTVIVADGKTEGAYANSISIVISDPTSAVVTEFKLQVKVGTDIKETFDNLSMTSTDDRYFVTIVNGNNGSDLIALTDPGVGTRPTNGTYGTLSGGNDGLTGLVDNDFIGNATARTGMYAAQDIETPFLLVIPEEDTAAIQIAALDFCETYMNFKGYYLADIPSGYTVAQAVTWVTSTSSLFNYSECGEIQFTTPKVTNPDKTAYGDTDTIEVSGACIVAGKMLRGENAEPGGVYKNVTGPDRGLCTAVVGITDDAINDKISRDKLYPAHINFIFKENGRYILDGARTFKTDSNFPTRTERRGVSWHEYYIRSIVDKYRGSTKPLTVKEAECERQIFAYLSGEIKFDAFASRKASEAFEIDTYSLNTAITENAGEFNVKVRIATVTPGDFNNIYVSKDTRAIDDALAALDQ